MGEKQQRALQSLAASKASAEEIRKARERVAIQSPEHLLRWLQETRPFLIFDSVDMSNALKPLWPEGAQLLQNVVNLYRSHRMTLPSGENVRVKDPVSGQEIDQALFKDDVLSDAELDRCIRWLLGEMHDRNPNWSLEDTPL